MLDLYARTWPGEPLGTDEYVISADEKTSIQARCRCHPALPPGRVRAMRVNHTYGRGGALAYLAAYAVHAAQVSGRCEPTTGIDPFMNLVAQVMSQEPYAGAKRVFWVVDNGSSHADSPPPTWTIYWPGSTDTHPPTDTKKPPLPWQPDQPPKDFQRRALTDLQRAVSAGLTVHDPCGMPTS